MAKVLVIASLTFFVSLVSVPLAFGHGLLKKDLDRSNKIGCLNIDPPYLEDN